MNRIRERYQEKFYRGYLWYTALETELLFFVVCDAMFLTEVKQLPMKMVSLLTFLSLLFSLLIQYPLLKWINRVGTRTAVRAGSIAFMLSAVCITFSPGFAMVAAGGFLKCIGHTLGAMGVAVLKNRLTKDHMDDQYAAYQSDANSASSFVMMVTSLLCGGLFRINAYYPMYACIFLSVAGIFVSYQITQEDDSTKEIGPADDLIKYTAAGRSATAGIGILVLASFAIFTAITGTGLSYAKLNIQAVLSKEDPAYIVSLISVISTAVFLLRLLSNLLMGNLYTRIRDRVYLITSGLLAAGVGLMLFPWFMDSGNKAVLLCTGYLLMAFTRDPYITFIQGISLEKGEKERQQSMLIALNSAKKAGSLILAASGTLLLAKWTIVSVMILMIAAALINVLMCGRLYFSRINSTFPTS